MNTQILKRTVKDSVFTNLFTEPKYLIQLYRALHPEDTSTTEQDIADVSIRNVLTDNQYNDLGFRIGNTVLVLLEAQSTWSVNIAIRILLYLTQTYNEFFTANGIDLYSSTKAELPRPELYVIYTGNRHSRPEYISLKDEFFGGQEAAVEVKVKVIYDGRPGDIINQYVTFTKVCNDQVARYGRTRRAIEETIRICIDEDVLAEYMKEREVEIMDIMTALFDEKEVTRRFHLRLRREAQQEAQQLAQKLAQRKAQELAQQLAQQKAQELAQQLAQQKAQELAQQLAQQKAQELIQQETKNSMKSIAQNMLRGGKLSAAEIAGYTGLSVQEIQQLAAHITP